MATPPRTPTPARKEKDPLKMSYEERARANEQRLAEARKGTPAEQALPTYRARSGSGGQAQKTQDYTVGAENLTIEASRGGGIVTVSGGTIEQQQAVSQSIAQAQRAKQDAVKAGEQAKAYLVSQQVQEVEAILKQQQALKNQSSQPKPSELPYDINKPILSPPTASQTPFIIQPALAPATSGQETVRLPPRQVTQTPQAQGMVTEYKDERGATQKLRGWVYEQSQKVGAGASTPVAQGLIQAGGEFAGNVFLAPFELAYVATKGTATSAKNILTGQSTITQEATKGITTIAEMPKNIIEDISTQTKGQQLGTVASVFLGGQAVQSVAKGIGKGIGAVRTIGKIEAQATQYAEQADITTLETTGKISPKVAGSYKNILEDVSKANAMETPQVVTASPQAIKGEIVGAGRKGSVGLEDAGIFTNVKGKASLYFTRIKESITPKTSETVAQTATSIVNPYQPVASLYQTIKAEVTKRPTISVIDIKEIVNYPQAVKAQAGFEATRQYGREVLAGQAKAVISKRSQIGFGIVQRQKFTVSQDFESPIPIYVEREGKLQKTTKVKKGDIIQESGTTESEYIIPEGSVLAKKASDKYIKVAGQNIFIDEYKVVPQTQTPKVSEAITQTATTKTPKYIGSSYKELPKTKTSAYYSPTATKYQYATPYTAVSTASYTGYTPQISAVSTVSKTTSKATSPYTAVSISTPSSMSISQGTSTSTAYSITSTSISQGTSTSTPYSSAFGTSLSRSIARKGTTQYIPPYKPTVTEPKEQKKKRRGFRVLVRKRGQFKAEGGVFSQQEALAFGAKKVSTTTSATFKLQEVEESPTSSFGGLNFLKNFYKKGELYIQKRGTRIGTIGEKQELRQAKQTKGIFGGLRK